jgi:aminoglycoside 3-N-acetyltransferase
VTADLTRLAWSARKTEGGFEAGALIDSFLDALGPEGTLIIPSFNFNLKNGDHFSYSRTLPVTGALAAEALKRRDFRRTFHPLHSFLVQGSLADELVSLRNISSFASDSPFALLRRENARMLILGTSISEAFTFVHHAEELAGVPYRRHQKIRIYLDDEDTTGEFVLYAKKPGWTMEMSGLENLLTGRGASVEGRVNRIPYSVTALSEAFPLILNEIRENQARHLARFSRKLYLRDRVKPILARVGIRTLNDRIRRDPGLL